MHYQYLDSPLGRLLISADAEGLRAIDFENPEQAGLIQADWQRGGACLAKPLAQLAAYFAGELRDFTLKLAPVGTPFRLEVWRELERIPYARTISYGELARRIGKPQASRAVGAANGANPIPVVLPCHRVIGADGSLTGYGGGVWIKQWLLAHERRHAGPEPFSLTA